MNQFRTIALLSALGAASFAHAAAAAPLDRELRRQTVRYADLDLSQEDGARSALRRIRWAASRVCGPPSSARELRQHRACSEKAMADAVRATNAPMLAAVHGGDAAAILLARK